MTNIADSIVVARAARRVLRGRVRSPLAAQMWARSHGATDAEIEGLGIVLTATKRRMPLAGKRCSSSSAIFKSAGLSLLGTAPRSRGAWGDGRGPGHASAGTFSSIRIYSGEPSLFVRY